MSRERSQKLTVAVIGAGPAGIAAAGVFAEAGLRVDIFEKESSIGGTVRRGHTPTPTRDKHLTHMEEVIQHPNIQVIPNITIGDKITTGSLLQVGYSAVVLAVGANKELRPPIMDFDMFYGRGAYEHQKVRSLIVELNDEYQQGNKNVWDTFPQRLLSDEQYQNILLHNGLKDAFQNEQLKFMTQWIDGVIIPGKGNGTIETAKFFAAWTVFQSLKLLGIVNVPDPVTIMNTIENFTLEPFLQKVGFTNVQHFNTVLLQQLGFSLKGPIILLTGNSSQLSPYSQKLSDAIRKDDTLIRIVNTTELIGFEYQTDWFLGIKVINNGQEYSVHGHVIVPTLGAERDPFPGMPSPSENIIYIGAAASGHGKSVEKIEEQAREDARRLLRFLQDKN